MESITNVLGDNHQKCIAILLPDLRGGGAERVAVNLANAFVQKNYAVEIILLSVTGALLSELSPEIRIVGLQVKRLRSVLLPLIKYLRQTRPDALLPCMWPLTVIALWARSLARVKTRVVVAEHTTWSVAELTRSPRVRRQVKTTMRLTFPKADGIVAVSQGAADDLARFARLDRNSINVIYNPVVDVNKIQTSVDALAPAAWWTGAHKRILAVGTLKPVKDYATLLNAFAQLLHGTEARLLILGEGCSRTALEEQVQQLGIEKSVFLPGFVNDPAPYYTQADLHVLSSTNEGLPTVIIEALDAGIPIVSTDCPSGPHEILAGGKFGRLVSVGDADALTAAMLAALKEVPNPERQKARASEFSIEKAARVYLALLDPEGVATSDIEVEQDSNH